MIEGSKLIWGAGQWSALAMGAVGLFVILLIAGYWRAGASFGVRMTAAGLKAAGIVILAMCLLEPLFSGQRARPGANQFVILADDSQSMALKDQGSSETRGEQLKSLTDKSAPWVAQLGRDFDLRQFAFDSQLRDAKSFDTLAFDGRASDLGSALDKLAHRYQGRSLAGILLMTDGGATDTDAVERLLARAAGNAGGAAVLPPIYPVLMGSPTPAGDISVTQTSVTQTNFEDAPVTLMAQVITSGYQGRMIVAELLDESGKSIEKQTISVEQDGQPLVVRFRFRPEQTGVSFYRVRVAAEGSAGQFEHPEQSTEATLANNSRLSVVDRGRGPYRVLYVAGRPDWEFKFLNRAVASDEQVQLVGLLRVAKREPKFNFIGRGEASNPLFHGFDNKDEQVEQYDKPVMVRVGTEDQDELRGGFPKTAEELFRYHAIIIDRLEAEFFTQDQMQLVKEFVRQRGGGLMMLGGAESFKEGKYDRTLIGDLLPVYVDQAVYPPEAQYRLALTREGWLEPWVRLHADEETERRRLDAMPPMETLNSIRGIKPGATVLARATAENGTTVPALVEQRFGQGRVGALLIGDLWRWEMRRPPEADHEMEKAWRQTVRWLVADVPKRVDVAVDAQRDSEEPQGTLNLGIQVRDAAYLPLDNATVNVRVTGPDGKSVELPTEPSSHQPGRYEAQYVPRQPGAYRAQVTATAPDGSDIGQVQTGWTSDPAAEEFRDLRANAALLERIARATGGQVVPANDLARFAASLPTRHAQITEPYTQPFWHQSWVFLLAIAFLATEWGLRRWKGLP